MFPEVERPGDGKKAESRGRGLMWGADFLYLGQPA